MKYIMDGKIYNTETSEIILIYKICNVLYKTKKGNYFNIQELPDRTITNVVSEDTVKKILLKYNYDKYAELFGPLEEA